MHFVWVPFLNSWFVLQIAETTCQTPPVPRGCPGWHWGRAENSHGAPEPPAHLQRCGRETRSGGAAGPGQERRAGPATGPGHTPLVETPSHKLWLRAAYFKLCSF